MIILSEYSHQQPRLWNKIPSWCICVHALICSLVPSLFFFLFLPTRPHRQHTLTFKTYKNTDY